MTNPSTAIDYIFIDGGTSKLAVANRLVEDCKVTFTALEAGQNQFKGPRVNSSAFQTSLLGTDPDWGFATTPEIKGSFSRLPTKASLMHL